MPAFPIDVLTAVTRVFDAVQARLNASVSWVPVERAYVTVGDIDFPTDCSQLVVSGRQVYAGTPGQPNPTPIGPYPARLSLEMGLAYTRCWQSVTGTGTTSVQREDTQARALLDETSAVLSAVWTAWSEHELVDPCDDLVLGPATWIGPDGGIAGVTVLLTVALV